MRKPLPSTETRIAPDTLATDGPNLLAYQWQNELVYEILSRSVPPIASVFTEIGNRVVLHCLVLPQFISIQK
jgi:hypothetical protein